MAAAAAAASYFTSSFDDFVESLMKEWNMPGVAIGIVSGDDIAAKGYGVIKPGGAKVTSDTLFDCASMSKSFTAASCALLVDNDEKFPHVQWDTPVSSLIRDDFVLHDPISTESVTIRDVLTHRTGVPGNDYSTMGRNASEPDTPRSITRKLRHYPPNKPLRSEWQYNNEMFVAASYMVETLAAQPFPDFLRERFWKPLEMTSTGFGLEAFNGIDPDRIAHPLYWDKNTRAYIDLPWVNGLDGQGAGEIKTTATDYAKWIRAMMNGTTGISEDNRAELVKPRLYAYTPGLAACQSPCFVAMGWEVEYYKGETIISHGGTIPGFTSFMKYMPASKLGFVMFANSDGMASAYWPISARLFDDHFKVPESERSDWNRLVHEDENKDRMDDEQKVAKVFPDRPNKPLPLPVSLESITGQYQHPGYGVMTLTVKDKQLFSDFTTRTYPGEVVFEHVSGDFFVAWAVSVPNRDDRFAMKAQIRVGVTSVIEEMGIDFVGEDGADMVWFKKNSGEEAGVEVERCE